MSNEKATSKDSKIRKVIILSLERVYINLMKREILLEKVIYNNN
jgi:hypothetical protein